MYLIRITHSYIIHIISEIIHLIKDGFGIFHFISSTDDCYLNIVCKILLLFIVSLFLKWYSFKQNKYNFCVLLKFQILVYKKAIPSQNTNFPKILALHNNIPLSKSICSFSVVAGIHWSGQNFSFWGLRKYSVRTEIPKPGPERKGIC